MPTIDIATLTAGERDLLSWLGEEEFSQYGECYGQSLTHLFELGLAQLHGPGLHQNFLANDPAGTKGLMYRAVSLTDAGHEVRAEILKTTTAAKLCAEAGAEIIRASTAPLGSTNAGCRGEKGGPGVTGTRPDPSPEEESPDGSNSTEGS